MSLVASQMASIQQKEECNSKLKDQLAYVKNTSLKLKFEQEVLKKKTEIQDEILSALKAENCKV